MIQFSIYLKSNLFIEKMTSFVYRTLLKRPFILDIPSVKIQTLYINLVDIYENATFESGEGYSRFKI